MRICIATLADFHKEGAAVRRVKLLGKALQAGQHDVTILVPGRFRSGPLSENIDGLKVEWGVLLPVERATSFIGRIRVRLALFRHAWRLCRAGVDWMILYNMGMEGVGLWFIGRMHKVRIANEYCDLRVKPAKSGWEDKIRVLWQGLADQVLPKLAGCNLVISRFLQEWARGSAPNVPATIIPPLFDSDRFAYSKSAALEFRSALGVREDEPVISYLGGFWDVDGVASLLEAAALMARDGEDFKLIISGEAIAGRDCDDVPALVASLGLASRVILTGWLDTDGVIAAMSAADILVVPKKDCLINRAGVPTKIAEYLAMGRAVVATEVGDLGLYLRSGADSVLVPPGDIPALANALSGLVRQPSLRQRLGENGRQTALRHFDYRALTKPLEEALTL